MMPAVAELASAPAPAAAPAPTPTASPTAAAAGTGTAVPAPLLGAFYHAPEPGADPFVATGDQVTPESVVGSIEVMKLMNQVQAGVSGTVTEIVAPPTASWWSMAPH